MKNIFYKLFFLSLILVSCEKKESEIHALDSQEQDVIFGINGLLEIKNSGSTSAIDTLKNFVHFVYDAQGNRLHLDQSQVSVTSNSLSSVNVKYKLRPGSYQFVFMSSDRAPWMQMNPNISNSYIYEIGGSDIFFKKASVTVGAEPVNQQLRLDRINAALEVHAMDNTLPADGFIELSFKNPNEFWFNETFGPNTSRFGRYYARFTNDPRNNETGRRLNLGHIAIFNTTTPQDIKIQLFSGNNLISTRIARNVKFERNKKTIISGYLNGPDATFNVSVSPMWGAPTETIRY